MFNQERMEHVASLRAGNAPWHLEASGNVITQHSQNRKKTSPYHNIKLLLVRKVGYFKKGNMGSHTIMSELVIHHEAMRLFGKQSPYKVSNYCQLRRTWVEYQLDFVDSVIEKRQRQTGCQCRHTLVRLHPIGGCFWSVQGQQNLLYIHPLVHGMTSWLEL